MNRSIVFLLATALAVLPSCNKKPGTPEGGGKDSPFNRQWLLTFEGYGEIYDYSVEPGFCYHAPLFWKDLPEATYLVPEQSISSYTFTEKDGYYHSTVSLISDRPGASLYEDFYNVTEKTASFKSIYHDAGMDEEDHATATVVEKPVKMVRTPFQYLGLKRGIATSNMRVGPGSLATFREMSGNWRLVVLGKEGAESDYAAVDVSGAIVAVNHTFDQPTKAGATLTPAQKRDIAAAKGAAALILQYENDNQKPFTLEQYKTIPDDTAHIPIAVFGSRTGLNNAVYTLVFE